MQIFFYIVSTSTTEDKKERKHQAKEMAAYLQEDKFDLDAFFISENKKTQKVLKHFNRKFILPVKEFQPAKHNLAHLSAQLPQEATALVIATEEEVRSLLPDRFIDKTVLQSGNLVMLIQHHIDKWQLSFTITQQMLCEGFPYPHPDGTERRPRPAYYYVQSGVIPYRIHQGKLEILAVSTRSGKRMVVPKGIIEPGLSAEESAIKEATEEAGITGTLHIKALGSYKYPKWGGICQVLLYGMEVSSLLPDEVWQESQRSRQWMSFAEARSCLPEEMLHLLDELKNVTLIN